MFCKNLHIRINTGKTLLCPATKYVSYACSSLLLLLILAFVTVPPDIDDSETSGDITVAEGENVTLTCRATGHPHPRIVWRREDGGSLVVYTTDNMETWKGDSIRLVRVERRQMGAYLCIASNDVPPAVSKRVTLHITFPPKVQVQKALVGAPLHSAIKLKCDTEAFPGSNNYWMKSEETIFRSEKYSMLEKKSGYKTVMLLTVHNITKGDFGTYTCIAQNTMGKSEDSVRLYGEYQNEKATERKMVTIL
nr:unnamed protein product [Callosobruchus chinensis]